VLSSLLQARWKIIPRAGRDLAGILELQSEDGGGREKGEPWR